MHKVYISPHLLSEITQKVGHSNSAGPAAKKRSEDIPAEAQHAGWANGAIFGDRLSKKERLRTLSQFADPLHRADQRDNAEAGDRHLPVQRLAAVAESQFADLGAEPHHRQAEQR